VGSAGLPATRAEPARFGSCDGAAPWGAGPRGRCGPAGPAGSRGVHGRRGAGVRVRAALRRSGYERPAGPRAAAGGPGASAAQPDGRRACAGRRARSWRRRGGGALGGGGDGAGSTRVHCDVAAMLCLPGPEQVCVGAGGAPCLRRATSAGATVRGDRQAGPGSDHGGPAGVRTCGGALRDRGGVGRRHPAGARPRRAGGRRPGRAGGGRTGSGCRRSPHRSGPGLLHAPCPVRLRRARVALAPHR
jgi:hypothetical protein